MPRKPITKQELREVPRHQYPEPAVTETPCLGSTVPRRGTGHRSPEGGTFRFSNKPSTASVRASSRVRRSESAARRARSALIAARSAASRRMKWTAGELSAALTKLASYSGQVVGGDNPLEQVVELLQRTFAAGLVVQHAHTARPARRLVAGVLAGDPIDGALNTAGEGESSRRAASAATGPLMTPS